MTEHVWTAAELRALAEAAERHEEPATEANQADLVTSAQGILDKLNSGILTTLSGSNVEIVGVTFAVSGGDTLRNTSANKPTASAAHTAIPYCYYYSVDTGVVEVTNGINWVVI